MPRARRRATAAIALTAAMGLGHTSGGIAFAHTPRDTKKPNGPIDWEPKSTPDGINVKGTLSQEQTKSLERAPDNGSGGGGAAAPPAVLYEYKIAGTCGRAHDASADCQGQRSRDTQCEDAGDPGPMASIWRREVSDSGPTSGWQSVAFTCFPEDVPGGKNNPQLTLAMIKEAWARTPFAKPQISLQPVGNKTLVTLPVYFKINWPAAGYRPDQVGTVSMLGHSLRIKPTFKANSYAYGDGNSSGKTTSFGGVYPRGDIKHPYSKKGAYKVHAATTYGGEFSLDGGPWMSISGTVSIAGPTQTLQVVTAKNRLVQ